MRRSKIRVRILCLLLCLAVLAPCASALGETTKVATYLLRLRDGPSLNAKVLDAYPRGTRVTILKKGSEWTKVRVHEKEGYMKTDMLAYGKYRVPETTETKTTTARTTTANENTDTSIVTGSTAYVMPGVRVNLREAAGGDSEIITSIRGGTKVTILKKGRYWSRIDVKGMEGYMWNEYLVMGEEEE